MIVHNDEINNYRIGILYLLNHIIHGTTLFYPNGVLVLSKKLLGLDFFKIVGGCFNISIAR